MKKIVPLITLVLLAHSVWAKDIEWLKNYDSALEQAKKEKKIVLVDIYTDWCGWCKKLDHDTYTDKEVQAKVATGFIAVKINPEKSPEGAKLAQQFGVRGFPNIVFINAEGKKLAQIGGYVNAATFLAQLEKVAKPAVAK